MAAPSRSPFALLEDQEGDVVAKSADLNPRKDWSHLPWEQQIKKKKKQQQPKQQQKKQEPKRTNLSMQPKPLVLPEHVTRNQFLPRRPKPEKNEGQNSLGSQEKRKEIEKVEEVSSELTLKEYEMKLLKDKSVSRCLNNGAEKKRMDIIGKKMSIDEFFKVVKGQKSFYSSRNGQSAGNVSGQDKFTGETDSATDINLEDAKQFPCLKRNA